MARMKKSFSSPRKLRLSSELHNSLIATVFSHHLTEKIPQSMLASWNLSIQLVIPKYLVNPQMIPSSLLNQQYLRALGGLTKTMQVTDFILGASVGKALSRSSCSFELLVAMGPPRPQLLRQTVRCSVENYRRHCCEMQMARILQVCKWYECGM